MKLFLTTCDFGSFAMNPTILTDDDAMPDFFTTAPSQALQSARLNAPTPVGFVGRAGVLLVKDSEGNIVPRYAFEALSGAAAGFVPHWEALNAEVLWPQRSEDAVPKALLTDGKGERFSLADFFTNLFADYPEKPWDQGGEALARRKARWREAISSALRSPAVQLLDAFNRSDDTQAIALAEWWVGPSPQHEIRHDGTLYPPRSASKLLLSRLTEGLALERVQPLTDARCPPELPVIFEDEHIVLVNKPARLASVPGIRETVSAKSLLEATRGPLRVVHRLDMDTSGLIVFAKDTRSERRLHAAFRDGLALKRYVARLEREIEGGVRRIELPLALNLLDRPRQCVLPVAQGGKPCATDVELLSVETMPDGTRKSIVALYPQTGRTHQLRVHCAHAAGLNAPIDGDPFYGRLGLLGEARQTRLCLHAAALTFPHPETGQPMSFEVAPDFPRF